MSEQYGTGVSGVQIYGHRRSTILLLERLFAKEDKKVWKLVLVILCYTICFAFSVILIFGNWFMIFISALPYVTLVAMSVFMWRGNGTHIRVFQVTAMSPAWIVHNIFNFSLGGILCETFNMISTVISIIRFRKEELDKIS